MSRRVITNKDARARLEELRERIQQAIGEYTATIMVDNPAWVFDLKSAVKLTDQILDIITE